MTDAKDVKVVIDAIAIHETVREHIMERWSGSNMAAVLMGICMLAANIAVKLGMNRRQFDQTIDDVWKTAGKS